MVDHLRRRQLLKMAGASTIAMATGMGATGCAAFNPAVASWLAELAGSIAATAVTDALKSGASKLWKDWQAPIKDRLSEDSYGFFLPEFWQHSTPPTVLIAASKYHDSNPMTDRLISCVDGGKSAVVFEAWAWQALSMYVHELTDGHSDDDLAVYQALAVNSLIPCGTKPESAQSPLGTADWMAYNTRNGLVEITRIIEPDGVSAIVAAAGIPDRNQEPRKRKFKLPDKAA